MRRVWILVPAALLLAACGRSSNKTAASSMGTGPALQTISLSEKEFSITPKAISVPKTGTYKCDVKKDGTITHSLAVEENGLPQHAGDIQLGGPANLRVERPRHHRRCGRRSPRERHHRGDRVRLLTAHDVLRARERVRVRLSRGLHRASAAARPPRDLLRARRLGQADREHLPRGHGLRQRPFTLHGDAARDCGRVDSGPRWRTRARNMAARALHRARPGARPPLCG